MSEKTNTDTNKKKSIYADGLWLKERTFNDGGSSLNVSVLVDKFTEFMQKHKKADGFVNLTIWQKREPKEGGDTHYAVLDTWVPGVPKSSTAPKAAKTPGPKTATESTPTETEDVPF
jgi:hypothetical protein